MILPNELQAIVNEAEQAKGDAFAAARAVPLLDLTTLEEDDDEARVRELCRRADTPLIPVAAVCVWPRFVPLARKLLKHKPVRVATVVNFPGGEAEAARVAEETAAAVEAGAHEIDVVMPYRAYIDGARAQPLAALRACREACGDGVTMKVILESGVYPDPELIVWASRDAIAAGADFLKTSTGKVAPAATLPAAALMLHAIHESGRQETDRPVGFKAAGGVRTTDAAAGYLLVADRIMGEFWTRPRTFRFGASALLDALLTSAGQAWVAGLRDSEY